MIGKSMKSLRQKANMTQGELAEKLNVSSALVSFWERDKREPDNEMLIKMADLFNVSVDFLLGQQDNVVSIMGKDGTYKKFKLSEKNMKALELLAETLIKDDPID